MENKNALNDKELLQINGGMVPFLEDVSGSELPNEKFSFAKANSSNVIQEREERLKD